MGRAALVPAPGPRITGLTIFYDDQCPACRRIQRWLGHQRTLVPLRVVAIGSPAAVQWYPRLDQQACRGQITAVADDGRLFRGTKAIAVCLWGVRRTRHLAASYARGRRWPVAVLAATLSYLRRRATCNIGSCRRSAVRRAVNGVFLLDATLRAGIAGLSVFGAAHISLVDHSSVAAVLLGFAVYQLVVMSYDIRLVRSPANDSARLQAALDCALGLGVVRTMLAIAVAALLRFREPISLSVLMASVAHVGACLRVIDRLVEQRRSMAAWRA